MAFSISEAAIEVLTKGQPPTLTTQQVIEVQAKLAAQKVGTIGKGSFIVLPLDNDPEGKANDKKRKQLILRADGSASLVTSRLGTGTRSLEVAGINVYKAYDLQTGQAQAVKETNVDLTATEIPSSVTHEREALTRAGQNFGEVEGGPCLNSSIDPNEHKAHLTFMALADGPNLEEMLYQIIEKPLAEQRDPNDTVAGFAKNTPPLAKAVAISSDVARSARELHQMGLVHRDLKPNNIHVSASGKVQIIDFGEALVSNDRQAVRENAEPMVDFIVGTTQYMSPEIFDAKGANAKYSTKSDSFALALTFAEIIFADINSKQLDFAHKEQGQHPLNAARSTVEDVKKILLEKLTSPTTTPPEKAIASLIGRMLSDNPAVRPTMNEAIIQFNSALIMHLKANPQEQGKLGDNLLSNLEFSKQEAFLDQFLSHPKHAQLLDNNKHLKQDIVRLQKALAGTSLSEHNSEQLKNITSAMRALESTVSKLPTNQGTEKHELLHIINSLQQTPAIQAQLMVDRIQQVIDHHEHRFISSSQDKELVSRLSELQEAILAIQAKGEFSKNASLAFMGRRIDNFLQHYSALEKMGTPLKENVKQELNELVADLKDHVKQVENIARAYVDVTVAPTTQAPVPQQASTGTMRATQETIPVMADSRKRALTTSFKSTRDKPTTETPEAKRAKTANKENESPNISPLDLEKVERQDQEIEAPRGQRPSRS
ncbi:MAG: protein kinase [Candidatus Berkiella sp.]